MREEPSHAQICVFPNRKAFLLLLRAIFATEAATLHGDVLLFRLVLASGNAKLHIEDKLISLEGQNNILGRAMVIHEKKDDLGKGGDEESKKTGNAGGRLACGVIGIVANK